MTELLNLIKTSLSDFWDFHKYRVSQMLRLATILKFLDNIYKISNSQTVAIVGKNSSTWVTVFLTCLITRRKLVILHENMTSAQIVGELNRNEVSILFIDESMLIDFRREPIITLTFIISMTQHDYKLIGTNYYELLDDIYETVNSIKTDTMFAAKDRDLALEILFNAETTQKCTEMDEVIVNYSSGTMSPPKGLKMRFKDILAQVQFLRFYINHKTPEFYSENELVTEIPNSVYFIYNILFPLVTGMRLTIHKSNTIFCNPLYVFQTRILFETRVKILQEQLLSKHSLLAMFINIPICRWFYLKHLKRQIINSYGGKVTHIFLTNGYSMPLIQELIRVKLPVHDMFHLAEVGGAVCIQDRVKKQIQSLYAVEVNEDDLVIHKPSGIIRVKDKKDRFKSIEAILEEHPLIKNCKIFIYNGETILYINPNIEAAKFQHKTLGSMEESIAHYIKSISNLLSKSGIVIDRIKLGTEDLPRNIQGEYIRYNFPG